MQLIDTVKRMMKDYVPGTIETVEFASVLIPLIKIDNELCFIFEKRSETVMQPGDICFPGGRMEAGETPVECAIRETYEEIGIPREKIQVLGEFDQLISNTGRRILTVAGIVQDKALESLVIDPKEVAEVFTVPVRFFYEEEPNVFMCPIIQDVKDFPYEENGIRSDYNWRIGSQTIYIYHYKKWVIWGMTAKIARWFAKKVQETAVI